MLGAQKGTLSWRTTQMALSSTHLLRVGCNVDDSTSKLVKTLIGA